MTITALLFALLSVCLYATGSYAQRVELARGRLLPNQVSVSATPAMGSGTIRVVKDSAVRAVDEPTFVRIRDIDFTNGTIEVKVLSRLLINAPESARGFIGIAFRINENNTSYESIYVRPTNARATDQIRRNHTIQYYSYPDYKFSRLRKEAPERYESYADMSLNEWITMRIVVDGKTAQLYVNGASQPALIVTDLKHGADASGGIGLWVDVGTEGFFRDLRVWKSVVKLDSCKVIELDSCGSPPGLARQPSGR